MPLDLMMPRACYDQLPDPYQLSPRANNPSITVNSRFITGPKLLISP
ncbi:unnamed protein product, partial [Vitis vinifera]|uniref:Uncharacterized protein n=1 Tax=Vitis vinifera TaxID=29760 RepID=D7T1K5_VITVI